MNSYPHQKDQLPKGISIVVPVYNSYDSLTLLSKRLKSIFEQIGGCFELIMVNDGSEDDSWDIIVQLSRSYEWCRGFNLIRNYGQHNAVLCGVRMAKYDTIVTMDDDLQHPPEEIPKLIEELANGYDCVYGKPIKYQHSFLRNLATFITKLALQKAMGTLPATNIGPFRAFRTSLRNAFSNYRGSYVSIDALLTWGTRKFSVVEVNHATRTTNHSNYTWKKLILHTINMMTGFSTLPLKLASLIGFSSAVLGVCLFVYVLLKFMIVGGQVPGFSFLASTLLIFSGAQLVAIGIMGEYLARIFSRTLDQPVYLVSETTDEI
jgi:undecaprenyl-phosphate 4-deoxy-4-formamido-L-arabinose transferase